MYKPSKESMLRAAATIASAGTNKLVDFHVNFDVAFKNQAEGLIEAFAEEMDEDYQLLVDEITGTGFYRVEGRGARITIGWRNGETC